MAVERVQIPHQPSDIAGLLAAPDIEGTFPGVVVIPTIQGLDGFIESVVERLAGEGFVALCVNILDHPDVPEDPFKRPGAQPDEQILGDLTAAYQALRRDPRVGGQPICAWGYCLGGRFSLLWPTYEPGLTAGAAFHGFPTNNTTNPNTPTEPAGRVGELQVPIIACFGEVDPLVPLSEVERYRAELTSHGCDFEIHVVPGADHGWTNPRGPHYLAPAAEESWRRTLQFLTRRIAARQSAVAPAW
jgi:carboxymethylenebutenolidase